MQNDVRVWIRNLMFAVWYKLSIPLLFIDFEKLTYFQHIFQDSVQYPRDYQTNLEIGNKILHKSFKKRVENFCMF